METDLRRLAVGSLATFFGWITRLSPDEWIKLLGGLVSLATIIYLVVCTIDRIHGMILRSRSRNEQNSRSSDSEE